MDEQTLTGIANPRAAPPPKENRHRKRMVLAIAILAILLISIELFLGIQDRSISIPYLLEARPVARVMSIDGDARYQPTAERNWFQAKVASDVFSGDAIYSGERTDVGVEMKSGGQLALGEETLVIFDSIDGVTVPDLTRGNIKLRILGDMKISISGDVTHFSAGAGGESEVLISIDEASKGKIQVLSGRPRIKAPKQDSKYLDPGSSLEFLVRKLRLSSRKKIDLPDTSADKTAVAGNESKEPKPLPTPIEPVYENPAPVVRLTKIVHTLTKSDMYQQQKGLRLKPKTNLPFIQAPGLLRWTGGNGIKTFVQVTKVKENEKPDFTNSWYNEPAPGQDLAMMNWRPGRNAWRVSLDGQSWSEPAEVDVSLRYAVGREPVLTVENPKVAFPNPVVYMQMRDGSGRKMSGWIIEGGRDKGFKKTVSVWAESSKLIVPVSKLGKYYFRVRSVDEHGEVSVVSNVTEVTVEKPKPVPVRLAEKPAAEKQVREVATKDRKVEKESPAESSTVLTQDTVAKERIFVRAGPYSVSLLGGLASVISVVQTETGTAPPVLQIVGLGGGYFDGRYEAKVNYRTRFGVASGSGSGTPSISRLDLRAGRWWNLGWRPFKTQTRLGLVAGYENFQNSGSRDFSPFYEVLKAGFGVNIDLTERVQTGGAVLFGTWMNSNSVAEIDGYFAYDFLENLNMGIGYRVGLFEAGTLTSSPSILPYREATGEAYSQLKFSF